ncbi:hypothetical protein [Siccirubricoccus sp. G192]|uniref:hypothetical protein n=1 Tax=Siccirubricoccus sp. G192 TaxID=2849651 RepID=UPI001C2BA31B|nr:hypothetical protein [Siccirubricoccus sp. G192]MBV1796842.1 hypothetical protein [Siccirubricoccus sp. G192]
MLAPLAANGLLWRVHPDCDGRQVALAVLRVLDEDGASPVSLSAPPEASDPRLVVLVKPGGLVVVTADPEMPLPPPFTLRLREPGFQPAEQVVALPADPALPVAAPELLLRRLPRSLGGRVVAAASGAPVPGATLSLAAAGPLAGALLLLAPPLGAAVPAATPVQGFPPGPGARRSACQDHPRNRGGGGDLA